MVELTKTVLSNNLETVFTIDDLKRICPKKSIRYTQLKEAIDNKEIIQINKEFFTLNRLYRKETINIFALSQRIDSSSYVSMTTALRYHNWIPETVYTCACVTPKRSKSINCSIFSIDFRTVKQVNYLSGVETIYTYGDPFYQAKPLKALTDFITYLGCNWNTLEPLIESLRIEEEDLESLTSEDFDELHGNYPEYPKTERFLEGIRRELGL